MIEISNGAVSKVYKTMIDHINPKALIFTNISKPKQYCLLQIM